MLPSPEQRLYSACLWQYIRDLGIPPDASHGDEGEAMADLLGDQRILRHLCDQAGRDFDRVSRTLIRYAQANEVKAAIQRARRSIRQQKPRPKKEARA